MVSRSFRLAMIQMYLEPGNRTANLARGLHLIEQAAHHGADVILLPEALPFGWMDPVGVNNADPIPNGDSCQQIRAAARKHRIYVCAGLVEKFENLVFNSAVLIDRSGEVVLHHRKINELEIAHHCYALGDRVGVVDTTFCRVGLIICADAFAPGQVITRTLALMGAAVILSPCAWAVPPGHDNSTTPYGQLWMDNYCPVCREFGVWIAGCSNVGPIRSGAWAGHSCIGCSLLVDPTGSAAAKGTYGERAEEILFADVTPKQYRRAQGES